MGSVYKNLSDDDLNIEKEALKTLEKKIQPPSSGNGVLKIAVVAGFVLSLLSLASSGHLYQSFNKEKREREALEAAQIQIRERASASEKDSKKSQSEIAQLSTQVKSYANLREEMTRKLEDSRKEVATLKNKLKDIEDKSLAMQKIAEEIQTNFDSQPIGPELPVTSLPVITDSSTTPAAIPAKMPHQPSLVAPLSTEPSVIKAPQVLSVNKKFNFVVVNVGIKDKIEIGDDLNIERAGKKIGSVTVEKVYDNFSAATITQAPKEGPLQEGDVVRKA